MKQHGQTRPLTPLLGSLLGLLILTVPLGTPGAAQSVSTEVRQGYGLLDKGWVNDAIATFRRALQRTPQSLEAKLGLAMAYQRAGQDTNAWQAYQAVLQQDGANRQALAALGELGIYRPEWQVQGITALTTLLQLDAANSSARAQRALLYGYQGRFPEALADYELLLSQNPKPETILAAAQIYTYSGDYGEGLALFQRYLESNTLPESALSAYALALQETGHPDQAVALLKPQLQPADHLDPAALQIRTSLATAYGAKGEFEAAIALLEPLRGQAKAELPLARALSTLGRKQPNPTLFEEAIGLYQRALAATTTPSYGLRVEVADVLSEWPQTQAEALTQYQKLVTENPADVGLRVKSLTLAYSLQTLSAQQAAAALGEALATLPTATAERRAIAQSLIRLQTPDPALLPVYKRIVAGGIDDPLLTLRIAQMARQQGDLAEAQAALKQYLATPEGQPDRGVALLLADIQRQQGDLEQVGQAYQALLTQSPDDVSVLSALAGLRFQQGRLGEAKSLYEAVLAKEPNDAEARLAIAELDAAQGLSLKALVQMQGLAQTAPSPRLEQQIQDLQVNLVRQRGFQPSWERY